MIVISENETETVTTPPTQAELEGLAAFELMIKDMSENDARMQHTERANLAPIPWELAESLL